VGPTRIQIAAMSAAPANVAASTATASGGPATVTSTPASGAPSRIAVRWALDAKPAARSSATPPSSAVVGTSGLLAQSAVPRTVPASATSTSSAGSERPPSA
jgi:hypothetical protein